MSGRIAFIALQLLVVAPYAVAQSEPGLPEGARWRFPPPFDDVLAATPDEPVRASLEFTRIVRAEELVSALEGFDLEALAFRFKHVGSGGGGTSVASGVSAREHLRLFEEYYRLYSLWKLKRDRCGRERAGAPPMFVPPRVVGGRLTEGGVLEAPPRGAVAVLGRGPASSGSVSCELDEDDLPLCPVDDATAPVTDTQGRPGDPALEAACGLRLNGMDVAGSAQEVDRLRKHVDFTAGVRLLPDLPGPPRSAPAR